MTVSEAFANFRKDLMGLLRANRIASPDPRWTEADILKALTEYFGSSQKPPDLPFTISVRTIKAAVDEIGELAQVAYEGYRDHTGGKSLATGQNIPEWHELRPDIKAAWRASVTACLKRAVTM